MRRLITAIALLVLVLASCFGCRWKLAGLSETLAAQVESYSTLAWQGDPGAAEQTLKDAQNVWQANRTFLGAVLPHTELDEVEKLFATARQAAENGDLSECRLRAAELKARLRHLPEREEPSLANIF